MARVKKSEPEGSVDSPITFHPCSNGEFCPSPQTRRDRQAEALFQRIVAEKSRRLGMGRRAFAQSACGYAAALFVINKVYGCGESSGVQPDGGVRPGVVGTDAAGFDASQETLEDAGLACERLSGNEFIMDVQVHTPNPLSPWTERELPMDAKTFLKTVFVGSDTTVACLSGVPGSRAGGVDNAAARKQLEQLVGGLAGPRLIYHVNADPKRGPSELDYMEQAVAEFSVAAWKVYPHVGRWRLDDDNGLTFLQKSMELGVRVVAAHRGIASDSGDYAAPSSPVDLVQAATAFPQMRFLTYHSGWQDNVDEDHPFDPDQRNPRGVDRLIKAVLDNGIGRAGNVYAELGSTWRNLMTAPNQAAHMLGKLLKHLGEDRIVWGTDAVFTGSPQEQIVAMRAFQIPERMQDQFGYPALSDAVRAKIFGLNAAQVYGIDPAAARCVLSNDQVDQQRLAYQADPRSIAVPAERRYGPTNRREFLRFLRWERS